MEEYHFQLSYSLISFACFDLSLSFKDNEKKLQLCWIKLINDLGQTQLLAAAATTDILKIIQREVSAAIENNANQNKNQK